MSTNVITPNAGIKLPIDLTPAERTKLKLISHFIFIAIFNAGLAAMALISAGKAMSWETVIISASAQGTLALLDALKKYYSASGQFPLSTIFDLVRAEAAAKLPAAPIYTTNEQALQSAFSNLFSLQTDTSPAAQQNAAKMASYSATPTEANTSAQGLQPVPAPNAASAYPAIPTSGLINSIPNLAAIKNTTQG